MSNVFEDLIMKRQKEMHSRQQERNNSENNVQSQKSNLFDLIRKTQEEMGRIRSARENNRSSVQTDSVLPKKTSSVVSTNNTPKTQADIDNMISSMNKVNANQKQVESKNFSDNVYKNDNAKIVNNLDNVTRINPSYFKTNKPLIQTLDENLNISGSAKNALLGVKKRFF